MEDHWSGLFMDPTDELREDCGWQCENLENNRACPAIPPGNSSSETSEQDSLSRLHRNGGLDGWSYASPFVSFTLNVDEVDQWLCPRFVQEANGILGNVLEEVKCPRLSGGLQGDSVQQAEGTDFLTPLALFNVFLPNSVLEKIRSNINRVLSSRKTELVNLHKLRGVIILHVLAASYSSPVYTIAAPANAEFFFQLRISGERYTEVWTALCCTTEKRQQVEYSDAGWYNKPTRGNALITELEQEFAAVNLGLLYVPSATLFALDDDHQRLSSRTVTQFTGLSLVNNPKKALGPVNNALCASLHPVFLASHYSRPREQLIHIWERLVQLLQGVPTSGALSPMTEAIFAADRGYKSKETIAFLNDRLCATGLGTHKRSLDYPFVFGDWPVTKKHKGMVVSEKGCRAIYSATRKAASRNGREVEATVYRESFSGRIAAVYHNNERLFSAKRFTLVPKDGFRGNINPSKLKEIQVLFTRGEDQRPRRSSLPNIPTCQPECDNARITL